jgi:hypothetical protein
MDNVDSEKLRQFRHQTFRTIPKNQVKNKSDAINFVNERGFIFFWPIKGLALPSLWVAVSGDRPVADEHDDPGHITWSWKDELLGKGIWYYGRVLARKNCMISLSTLPYFYALSPNYGDPETDYLEDYRQGNLTNEAKTIYECLLKNGPMDTINLRKTAHLSGPSYESKFNKAVEILQTSFRIVPIGISKAGGWHYAFIYDVFHRHFSDQITQARRINGNDARETLLLLYLKSVGVCSKPDLRKIFMWENLTIEKTVRQMERKGELSFGLPPGPDKEFLLCLPEILKI